MQKLNLHSRMRMLAKGLHQKGERAAADKLNKMADEAKELSKSKGDLQ